VTAKKGRGTKKKGPPGPFEALRALKEELEKREKAASTPAKKGSTGLPAPAPRTAPRERPRETGPTAASDDDALVMHRLFAGVQPLPQSPGRLPRQALDRPAVRDGRPDPRPKQAADAARAEAEAVHEHLRTLVEGKARFEVEDDGVRVEGRRLDLPLDALRRLRRGLLPIDGRVDLHGMGAQEARTHVELFLRTMRSRGERCVLVIHGKGEHSPQGTGVLRGEIAAWLSQSAASEHVAAFATAKGSDGGEGAVYVLLRR
jgi:DNA-nicking Smr family endonuclease